MDNSMTAIQRIESLFDEGTFKQTDAVNNAGVITGYGDIFGFPVFAFSQDISVCGGAVTFAHAKKIEKLYELAGKAGLPVVGIYDSYGAKLEEGTAVLNAYGKIAKKAAEFSGVVPQISYIAGACLGVCASVAQMSDFVVMTKSAELFCTPPSGDFDKKDGNAENAAKKGIASIVCENEEEALSKIKLLISSLPANNLSAIPQFEYDNPEKNSFLDVNEAVKSIADNGSLIELFEQYGNGAFTALGKIQGSTVGFIGANGKLSCEASGKITRFVSVCDAFSIPVVSVIDCEGFVCEGKSMSRLINAFSLITSPYICVALEKAIGSAYIAFCSNADMLYAFNNTVTAPLSPKTAEGFNSVSADEYTLQNSALNNPEITEIITAENARQTIETALYLLSGKRVASLPKKHSNLPY